MSEHKTKIDDPAFTAWCEKLDAYVAGMGEKTVSTFTLDTGRECWLGYYEDGLSPEEAYAEDCSYA